MIGTAIPAKTPIADLPPEVSETMNGYWGDQYLMIQNKMVVVDQHTRPHRVRASRLRCPASVGATLRVVRVSNRTPIWDSSRRIV
jgi:hypothetical protein